MRKEKNFFSPPKPKSYFRSASCLLCSLLCSSLASLDIVVFRPQREAYDCFSPSFRFFAIAAIYRTALQRLLCRKGEKFAKKTSRKNGEKQSWVNPSEGGGGVRSKLWWCFCFRFENEVTLAKFPPSPSTCVLIFHNDSLLFLYNKQLRSYRYTNRPFVPPWLNSPEKGFLDYEEGKGDETKGVIDLQSLATPPPQPRWIDIYK